ncbi:MAG: CvpA family protein [Eubacteriales bacterium]
MELITTNISILIDVVVAVIIILQVHTGFKYGFAHNLRTSGEFLALLASIVLMKLLGGLCTPIIEPIVEWLSFTGVDQGMTAQIIRITIYVAVFFIAFMGLLSIWKIISDKIEMISNKAGFRVIDRVLGLIFGLIKAVVIILLLIWLLRDLLSVISAANIADTYLLFWINNLI